MSQKRILRKLNKIVHRVNDYAEYMRDLTDEELAGQTDIFRKRLQDGETLDELLPEAFAAIREADGRILGKYPYDHWPGKDTLKQATENNDC